MCITNCLSNIMLIEYNFHFAESQHNFNYLIDKNIILSIKSL